MATRRQGQDAGKTSGGGSLGHDQPADVADEARIRNQSRARDIDRQGELREKTREEAPDDPVMPDDRSTLRTKI